MTSSELDVFLSWLDHDDMFDGWEMTVRHGPEETVTQVLVRLREPSEDGQETLCVTFVDGAEERDCVISFAAPPGAAPA